MPFREDLDAAMARADVAERELGATRERNAADHQRIAELEAELANARRDVQRTKDRAPPAESAESDMEQAAARNVATFNVMHRVGGAVLLVFAVACLTSAIYIAVNGITPSLIHHVRGLHARDASDVIIFLVVMAALNGGIAVRMLAKPMRQ